MNLFVVCVSVLTLFVPVFVASFTCGTECVRVGERGGLGCITR